MKRALIHSTAPVLLVVALISSSGCGGGAADRPTTVPVSGTVAYKGQPIEGASVSFMVEGAPRVASGITDKDGKFHLSTFAFRDGAIIGTHKITVTKSAPNTSSAKEASAEDLLSDPAAVTAQMQSLMEENGEPEFDGLLPEKYSTFEETPLSETVSEEGPNEFVLQLTD